MTQTLRMIPGLWGMFGLSILIGSLALCGSTVMAQEPEDVAALLDAGDAGHGETVFKKCRACHEIGPDAKNKVGPYLTGVIGRPAGSIEGFSYSNGIKGAAEQGLVWEAENVFAYIADPRGYLREVSGNPRAKAKMTFKLPKAQDRADVIAYLKTFSEESSDSPDSSASAAQ